MCLFIVLILLLAFLVRYLFVHTSPCTRNEVNAAIPMYASTAKYHAICRVSVSAWLSRQMAISLAWMISKRAELQTGHYSKMQVGSRSIRSNIQVRRPAIQLYRFVFLVQPRLAHLLYTDLFETTIHLTPPHRLLQILQSKASKQVHRPSCLGTCSYP